MLTLDQLTVGYANERGQVLDPVSLTLEPGSFVCVIGRNGAGKSTLMRTISGLQTALSGVAQIDGVTVADMTARDRAQAISVVTTERVSSPGLLARDVVELGRQPYTNWQGNLREEDRDIVRAAIEQVGAKHLAPKPFDGLSDGERQRIMIARALSQTSKIMVLDEITAFLDLPGRVEIMALLRRHAVEQKKIILLSSHDLELSLELAEYLWVIDSGKLVFGSAQDLVNAGSIGGAFDTPEVEFNGTQRRFVLK